MKDVHTVVQNGNLTPLLALGLSAAWREYMSIFVDLFLILLEKTDTSS